LDEQPREGGNAAELLRIFDGCVDVREVSAETLDQVDHLLESAWAADRGLKLFLLLLDPEEPKESLQEYADCLEELLAENNVQAALEYRLLAAPMPILVEIIGVENACRAAPQLLGMFRRLLSLQAFVQKVSAAFELIPPAAFGGELEKSLAREALVEDGAFSDLVQSLGAGEDIRFLKMKLINAHRRMADPIGRWTASLQTGSLKLPRAPVEQVSEADWDDDGYEIKSAQSHEHFLQIRAQQKSIVDKLKARDLAGARRLTQALIESQRLNSTDEQIAKSLSFLAQRAKIQEIPELQLEWSEWATEVNPLDPITFGHLADALVGLGRLADAEVALNRAEQAGDPAFAAVGRARIMRVMGRPAEARAAYLSAASEYEGTLHAFFAAVGAAETLRDMGENEAALAEYQKVTEKWAGESAGWAGLASVLMDMGRLDEAIITFGKAGAGDRSDIAKNGRATSYKLAGNFDASLKLYSEIIRDYPNNHVALCGRAEVLRAKGQFDAALAAYDLAAERAPYSVVPIAGKAGLLREIGRFQEATTLYREGIQRFPFDHQMVTGLAAVLRGQGQYSEALAAFDDVLQRFPFDITAKIARASVLHHLGADEDALVAYDEILFDKPYSAGAGIGKAALLISLKRYDEASLLLPEVRPTSQVEWRRFVLRAFLTEVSEGSAAAARMLTRGLENCPFAKEKRSMRSALVALELRRNRFRDARRLVESAPLEVTNVVALHALAACHRPGQAKLRLKEIVEGQGPPVIIELAKEIARRHHLIDETPKESLDWIQNVERQVLILEAA